MKDQQLSAWRLSLLAVLYLLVSLSIGAIVEAIYVYVFHGGDPKFRDAPSIEFQMDMVGITVFALVGAALITATLVILKRSQYTLPKQLVVIIVTAAALFPVLLVLQSELTTVVFGDTSEYAPAIIAWLFIACFFGAFLGLIVYRSLPPSSTQDEDESAP